MGTTTSIPPVPGAKASAQPGQGSQSGIDRRRRRRAKISAQVHVRAVNSPEPFEEVCMSIDVSRDGLLFASKFSGYWKGQILEVAFPYSNMAGAINQGQPAEVVRIDPQTAWESSASRFNSFQQSRTAKASEKRTRPSPQLRVPRRRRRTPASPWCSRLNRTRAARKPCATCSSRMAITVIVVPTAQAALEILRTTVPSVFIAEVEAEDMSGQDLCVIIKQNERLQKVPVILMTRAAQPADYAASHQLGAVVCMAKPFKPERLQQVVRLVAPPPALRTAYGARTGDPVERPA